MCDTTRATQSQRRVAKCNEWYQRAAPPPQPQSRSLLKGCPWNGKDNGLVSVWPFIMTLHYYRLFYGARNVYLGLYCWVFRAAVAASAAYNGQQPVGPHVQEECWHWIWLLEEEDEKKNQRSIEDLVKYCGGGGSSVGDVKGALQRLNRGGRGG